ncbi:hypothetical protein ABPG77_010043 [Micractinium sp. CCAP 211/92]
MCAARALLAIALACFVLQQAGGRQVLAESVAAAQGVSSSPVLPPLPPPPPPPPLPWDPALLKPRPRTDLATWDVIHRRLLKLKLGYKAAGGLDVAAYGDSILMTLLGDPLTGGPLLGWGASKAAWDRAFGGRRAGIFAIGGDRPANLLWRLRHGEGPRGLHPRGILLLIGVNDILPMLALYPGNDTLAAQFASAGIQLCVRALQKQAPNSLVIVLGLLPFQPPPPDFKPGAYDRAVRLTNRATRQWIQQQNSLLLKYKDCGLLFLLPNSTMLNSTLVPDGIHPSGPGAPVLVGCMRRALAEWGIAVRRWPAPPPGPTDAASHASAGPGHPLPTLTLPVA